MNYFIEIKLKEWVDWNYIEYVHRIIWFSECPFANQKLDRCSIIGINEYAQYLIFQFAKCLSIKGRLNQLKKIYQQFQKQDSWHFQIWRDPKSSTRGDRVFVMLHLANGVGNPSFKL